MPSRSHRYLLREAHSTALLPGRIKRKHTTPLQKFPGKAVNPFPAEPPPPRWEVEPPSPRQRIPLPPIWAGGNLQYPLNEGREELNRGANLQRVENSGTTD